VCVCLLLQDLVQSVFISTCEGEFRLLRKSRHGHLQNQTRGSRLFSLNYDNITTRAWVWGHEYVITSLLGIFVSKNKTRRPPSAGGTLDRTSFAATRSVCLEGALARPCTILVPVLDSRCRVQFETFRTIWFCGKLLRGILTSGRWINIFCENNQVVIGTAKINTHT
jgi:hypothetical protein